MIEGIDYTDRDQMRDLLSVMRIIDMGIIHQYNFESNTCTVECFRLSATHIPVTYENVEVMFTSGLYVPVENCPCMVFTPRSPVRSVLNREVDFKEREFTHGYMKCIPLIMPQERHLSMGFTATGAFTIATDAYHLTIDDTDISYANASGSVRKSLMGGASGGGGTEERQGDDNIVTDVTDTGNIEVRYLRTADGRIAYRMYYTSDGTYTVQRNQYEDMTNPEDADERATFDKYIWQNKWNTDGSVTWEQVASNGDKLNTVTISGSGDITISQTKAENTIALKQDGTLSISTKADISVTTKGKVTVKPDGKLSLQGGGKNLFTILNSVLTKLNSSYATQGSPGAHTPVPNQMQQEANDLGTMME